MKKENNSKKAKKGQKEKIKKIAILPLDDRPCSYEHLKMLVDYSDYKVELPPKAILGKFLKDGKPDKLDSWLVRQSKTSSAVLISIDSLLFGNLIGSRTSSKALPQVLKRLNTVKKIAKQKKCENVYVFNVLTRLVPTTKSKKDIEFTEKLRHFLYLVYNKIKFKKVVFRDNWWNIYKLEEEAQKFGISWNKVKEYLKNRLRNHKINLVMLDWAKQGLFEYLLLCLDDTKTASLNLIEKEILRKKLKALNLKDKVSIYSGTDEAACLQLTRFFIKQKDVRPKIFIDFIPSYGSRVVPIYEDISIKEIVSDQISAVSALQVALPDQADIVLMVNAPVNQQYEASSQEGKAFQKNRLFIYKEFLNKANQYFAEGKLVAVADVAFANGADIGLAEVLRKNIDITKLAAYSAWNTAGNTLGAAISQASLYYLYPESRKSKPHFRLMINRLLDDWLYQSIVRPYVTGKTRNKKVDIYNLGSQLPAVQKMVVQGMKKVSQRLFNESFKDHESISGLQLKRIKLPWPRIFEVDLDVDMKVKN